MSKKCKNTHSNNMSVAEPMIAYGVNAGSKSILENTMSVDEYFNKLLSLVHKDYENILSQD